MRVDEAFNQFNVMAPGVPVPPQTTAHLPRDISTEQAAVMFGIVNGVFTSVSQLLAGGRLSGVEGDSISLRTLAPSLAIGAAGLLLATRFVPTN